MSTKLPFTSATLEREIVRLAEEDDLPVARHKDGRAILDYGPDGIVDLTAFSAALFQWIKEQMK